MDLHAPCNLIGKGPMSGPRGVNDFLKDRATAQYELGHNLLWQRRYELSIIQPRMNRCLAAWTGSYQRHDTLMMTTLLRQDLGTTLEMNTVITQEEESKAWGAMAER